MSNKLSPKTPAAFSDRALSQMPCLDCGGAIAMQQMLVLAPRNVETFIATISACKIHKTIINSLRCNVKTWVELAAEGAAFGAPPTTWGKVDLGELRSFSH